MMVLGSYMYQIPTVQVGLVNIWIFECLAGLETVRKEMQKESTRLTVSHTLEQMGMRRVSIHDLLSSHHTSNVKCVYPWIYGGRLKDRKKQKCTWFHLLCAIPGRLQNST